MTCINVSGIFWYTYWNPTSQGAAHAPRPGWLNVSDDSHTTLVVVDGCDSASPVFTRTKIFFSSLISNCELLFSHWISWSILYGLRSRVCRSRRDVYKAIAAYRDYWAPWKFPFSFFLCWWVPLQQLPIHRRYKSHKIRQEMGQCKFSWLIVSAMADSYDPADSTGRISFLIALLISKSIVNQVGPKCIILDIPGYPLCW